MPGLPGDQPPDELSLFTWVAIPAATYEGVFTALGLHDRIPATTSAGLSAVENDPDGPADPAAETPATVHRGFVTAEFSGWRLILGAPVTACADHEVLARLSAHCGQAHFYFRDCYDDCHSWAIAENGRVIRSYQTYGEPEWTGEPLPWETPQTEDEGWEPGLYEPNASLDSDAGAVAHMVTVDPDAIDLDTPMRGHGWLAVTAPGIGHEPFSAATRGAAAS